MDKKTVSLGERKQGMILRKNGGTLWKSLDEGRSVMWMRMAGGEATDPITKVVYDLSANAGTMSPIIENKTTGRVVMFSWQDLIEIAQEIGIDETTAKKKAKKKR